MPQSFNQLFEKVVELLKEQVHIVLIVAIVVLFCLLLIVIKKIAKRNKNEMEEESLDFIENLKFDIEERKAEEKKAKEKEQGTAEQVEQKKQELQTKQTDQETQQEQRECETQTEDTQQKSKHQTEQETDVQQTKKEIKNEILDEKGKIQVVLLQELIEEITKISPRNLEEVQIKIQGAEIRLKYTRTDSEAQVYRYEAGAADKNFKENTYHENCNELEQEDKDYTEVSDTRDKDDAMKQSAELDPAEEEILKFEEMLKEMQRQRAEEEKVAAELLAKFGADNCNTTRTGRVFTEKELEEQIRD